MSTVEELQRDCAYCGQAVTLKRKNGLTPSDGARLVFDQVFHDKCWDTFLAKYNGRRALRRAIRTIAGAGLYCGSGPAAADGWDPNRSLAPLGFAPMRRAWPDVHAFRPLRVALLRRRR
jgi:hypothetical protein